VRAASLLGVLVFAKALTLVGHRVPVSPWSPFAYFWQDVAVALAFAAFDRFARRPSLAWILYAAIVVYAAVNVAVAHVLSSPLTWTMLRAARGPLADSMAHELSPAAIANMAAVLAAGIAWPWLLQRRRVRVSVPAVACALSFVAIGVIGVSRVETVGLHRNAIVALLPMPWLRAGGAVAAGDPRTSPDGPSEGEDLSTLRGAAAGWNVVLVALESTAAQYLALYGADDATPNLTALGRRSIVFDHAYAAYPESIKGLLALLCGRAPAFDTSPETDAQRPCNSLPAILSASGYRTALFHSGRFAYLGMRSVIEGRGFDLLEDAGAIGGNTHSSFGVDDASTVGRLLAWVDSLGPDRRFFATYLPVAGHHPYATTRPGPFDSSTEFGRYRNALHEGDDALGDLLTGLRVRGLDRRTLIVLLGDHGEAFGQHDGNFGHTMFIYDENVHVPLVIAGVTETELRVGRVASAVDTAPTILDLLGLPVMLGQEGRSLLTPERRMALFFTDYSLGWLGLRDGCWKYVLEVGSGRSKLFDVCADPGEQDDRSAAQPARARAYRARVEK